MYSKQAVKRVKSAVIEQCLDNGIDTQEEMSVIVVEALKTVGPKSIAGAKAAIAKGQTLIHQQY